MAEQADLLILNMAVNTREVTIRLDDMISRLDQVAAAAEESNERAQSGLNKTATQAKTTAKEVSGLEKTWSRLNKTLGLVGISLSVATAIGVAKWAFNAAHQVEAVSSSFEVLSENAGQSADQMVHAMRRGSRGWITGVDLMRQANNALLLELPVNATAMESLTEAATKLGRAMGLDAAKSLESLIVGIGRQSRLWLDNLGIVVKADEAYRRFAESVGAQVSQLTEAERKWAFYLAAVEAAETKAEQLTINTETLTGQVDELTVRVTDLTQALLGFANVQVGSELQRQMGAMIVPIIQLQAFLEKRAPESLAALLGRTLKAGQRAQEIAEESRRSWDNFFAALEGPPPEVAAAQELREMDQQIAGLEDSYKALLQLHKEERQLAQENHRAAMDELRERGQTALEVMRQAEPIAGEADAAMAGALPPPDIPVVLPPEDEQEGPLDATQDRMEEFLQFHRDYNAELIGLQTALVTDSTKFGNAMQGAYGSLGAIAGVLDVVAGQNNAFSNTMRKIQAGMLKVTGAISIAEGAIKVASSIWPPRPAELASGLAMIRAGTEAISTADNLGAQGGVSAGGSRAAATSAGRGGGPISSVGGGTFIGSRDGRVTQPPETTIRVVFEGQGWVQDPIAAARTIGEEWERQQRRARGAPT